jgi:hypothetical protein
LRCYRTGPTRLGARSRFTFVRACVTLWSLIELAVSFMLIAVFLSTQSPTPCSFFNTSHGSSSCSIRSFVTRSGRVGHDMTLQQVLHRALPSRASLHHRQHDRMPETQQRRRASLQASLAEMTLVNRLRAYTRTDLALDTLHRAAAIIELTAKHWFSDVVDVRDRDFTFPPEGAQACLAELIDDRALPGSADGR